MRGGGLEGGEGGENRGGPRGGRRGGDDGMRLGRWAAGCEGVPRRTRREETRNERYHRLTDVELLLVITSLVGSTSCTDAVCDV